MADQSEKLIIANFSGFYGDRFAAAREMIEGGPIDVLTGEKLKALLPDVVVYDIERYEFPNLLALNFYIKGVLGDGVSASLRMDPQAKTLGEYLRTRVVEFPKSLIG